MTEITNAPDFDLDAWLDGAKRTERSVIVYGRADLLADIDLLEAEQRTLKSIPEEDRSMGGDDADELQRKIDDLNVQMNASKMVLRVRSLIGEELESIRVQANIDLKDALDKAAASARADAKLQCTRAGVTAANDVNTVMRNAAAAAVQVTLEMETDLRTIASAVVSPPMDAARVTKLIAAIGEKQVDKIKEAYSRATNEEPRVQLPKSLTPSQTDDGAMSS